MCLKNRLNFYILKSLELLIGLRKMLIYIYACMHEWIWYMYMSLCIFVYTSEHEPKLHSDTSCMLCIFNILQWRIIYSYICLYWMYRSMHKECFDSFEFHFFPIYLLSSKESLKIEVSFFAVTSEFCFFFSFLFFSKRKSRFSTFIWNYTNVNYLNTIFSQKENQY